VKVGERVPGSQLLAQVGYSGDAREPHLHLGVTTSAELLAGEGVPNLIDRYRTRVADEWQTRSREPRLGGMLVDFGQGGAHAH
jgi:hypothetical protein